MDNTIINSMRKISKHANLVLLLIALLSFCFLGYFKTWYYQELFSVKFSFYAAFACGVALAVMIEGARFAFLLSSASDLLNKNYVGFFFGIVGSLGLFYYEWKMCESMGLYWNSKDFLYVGIFRSVAAIGAIIELRLCLMLKESKKETPSDEKEEKATDPEHLLIELLEKLKGGS